ncbi:MAG: aspartate dehydrogenase [Clostridiales bacterium]|nr:aspartate dehydrogenase [Clostridiales bacterium]
MMFGKKKSAQLSYDKENETPAVKSSICTGEKTAGFIDNKTGKYRDVMLIKSDADIAEFKRQCGVDEVKTIY